jgi:hypothetical protein
VRPPRRALLGHHQRRRVGVAARPAGRRRSTACLVLCSIARRSKNFTPFFWVCFDLVTL